MRLADEKYVLFTTYTRSGKPKPTPVWMIDAGNDTVGFTTFSTSWKVKRLNNDPRVALQPCDSRGKITEGSTSVEGSAVAVQGADFERVVTLIKGKYGYQFTLVTLFGKVRKLIGKDSGTDTAIIVTVNS